MGQMMQGGWHSEAVDLPADFQRLLVLRRYPAGAPDVMYEARRPFDGVAHVLIAGGVASIAGMLVVGPAMRRHDRGQIADILRAAGATSALLDRGGRPIRLTE